MDKPWGEGKGRGGGVKTPATILGKKDNSLRWLKTVSSTKILIGCYSHSLSLVATIIVSKNCLTIDEHVVVLFIT